LQGQTNTTIVIADDHPLFRGALRQAIGSLLPRSRVLEATGLDALKSTLAVEKEVDLILLDLTMPGVQGFSGLISLRAENPTFRW
jgi:DNA-binding NarL/FixJ family response regulator